MGANMGKRGRLAQPTGSRGDVTDDERAEVRRLRTAAKLRQGDLAAKIGVSAATISNLETGRSKQPLRETYQAAMRALKGRDAEIPDTNERIKRINANLLKLDARGLASVEAVIDAQLSLQAKAG